MGKDDEGVEITPEAEAQAEADFEASLDTLSDEEKDTKRQERREQKDTERVSFRGKLNAQNRFLKKEGYEFEEGKGWVKKTVTPEKTEKKDSDLSSKDLYALMGAKVHEDDVDEVVKLAKAFGKTVPEALKDTTVQAVLSQRGEHRKTANASNTAPTRNSTKAPTDDEIKSKADKGEVPDKGSTEAEQLFWARRGGKKK